MFPRPDFADLLRRLFLEPVRDALLRLVAPLGVEKLAFVAVGALLPVRARLNVAGDGLLA